VAVGTLATADAILKDLYHGPIIEQLNYKTYMLDMIERDASSLEANGRRWVVSRRVLRATSPHRRCPTVARSSTRRSVSSRTRSAPLRYHNAAVELSDQLIQQANGNDNGAFLNKLDREVDNLGKAMRKNLNRQVFGDGTGLIATLTTSPAAATTFTVDASKYLCGSAWRSTC
jgi:hypothetical protein